MVLARAARARGIIVCSLDCFDKPTNFFSMGFAANKRVLFEAFPLAPLGRAWRINFDKEKRKPRALARGISQFPPPIALQ